MQITSFYIDLPEWVIFHIKNLPETITSHEERIHLVNELAYQNFLRGTGGPFAAAIFERDTGKLISVGVNRVISRYCSSAHAEIVCLSLAQRILNTYDLGGTNMPIFQLVVNWRPCVMCFGATLWSGIRSLLIPGGGPELEQITGFDEGPMHPEWREELKKRGIELIEGIGKKEAIKVFNSFAKSNSIIYNARQGLKKI